jgi:hypothetical protein
MNFSQITDDLFIGSMPTAADYEALHALGVRLVINMRFLWKLPSGVTHPPFEVLWLRSFDNPLLPISLRALMKGAQRALEIIREGGKIYSHCAYGRHRGVAMGAAILIAQGYTAEAAMELIKAKRPVADPQVFYIKRRILLFAKRWHEKI